MVIVYLVASLLGAVTTVMVLSPQGWLLALMCAPFGASALTLILAAGVYAARIVRRSLLPAGVAARP
jgi:hypothetical protein